MAATLWLDKQESDGYTTGMILLAVLITWYLYFGWQLLRVARIVQPEASNGMLLAVAFLALPVAPFAVLYSSTKVGFLGFPFALAANVVKMLILGPLVIGSIPDKHLPTFLNNPDIGES